MIIGIAVGPDFDNPLDGLKRNADKHDNTPKDDPKPTSDDQPKSQKEQEKGS